MFCHKVIKSSDIALRCFVALFWHCAGPCRLFSLWLLHCCPNRVGSNHYTLIKIQIDRNENPYQTGRTKWLFEGFPSNGMVSWNNITPWMCREHSLNRRDRGYLQPTSYRREAESKSSVHLWSNCIQDCGVGQQVSGEVHILMGFSVTRCQSTSSNIRNTRVRIDAFKRIPKRHANPSLIPSHAVRDLCDSKGWKVFTWGILSSVLLRLIPSPTALLKVNPTSHSRAQVYPVMTIREL